MRNAIAAMAASGLSIVWSAGADAQVAAQSAPEAEEPGAPQQDRSEQASPALKEIVVTAQRREQSLQDVPISVNAFDAEALGALSAETMGDLDSFTPGLQVDDDSVTQPRYSIRGVQTSDFGIGTEPSVGIFIDGVYAARSGESLIFFNDVERVEVLKGPQGTLFGRNTSAGAISIVTNKPVNEIEAFGTLQLGNYGKVRVDATANAPLTDTLYLRLNGVFNRRNGFLKDAITDDDRSREDNTSGRAALRWAPTADTDFLLTYDHDDTDKDGPTAVGISTNALTLRSDGPFANDVIDNKETRILNGVTFTAKHDIGALELASITAYKAFETHNREDEDGTADPTRYLDTENIEHNKNFYQELRATYTGGTLDVLVGASYFWEHGRQTSAVTLLTDSVDRAVNDAADFPIFSILDSVGLPVFGLPFEEDMNNQARNKSYAVFGDATVDVSSRLSLTAGLRYTHDDKAFTWLNGGFIAPGLAEVTAPGALYNAILGAPAFPDDAAISAADFFAATVGPNGLIFDVGPLEGQQFTRRETFDDVSPRFVVNFKPDADILLYASAARGYKAGGFNSLEINSFFDPENVWNFESGVKSEVMDHRVRLNGSVYYFKYKNRQSISLEDTGDDIPHYITRSGDSRAWGMDLEAQFVATPDLTLALTAGYLDSIWSSRVERDIDISGQPTGAPAFTGVASAHYDHQIGSGGSIYADASYSYTSASRSNDADRDADAAIAPFVDFDLLENYRGARNIVNARIGYRFPGDRFSVSLYAENLLDDRTIGSINDITADIFQTPYVRPDRPALFGIEFGARY